MAKGQKAVPIDEYTYELLQQAVSEGKAYNLADAILRGISTYLGVKYKSKQERKLKNITTHIQQLAKMVAKEE